ncbi:uncharacterized protein LOC143343978 [Colletes latitarsis]|uniref:uncharacterized protein LOC143343978 n=1 Tax=Colletes latitarsis TaxID=2605962 RepID=UPI004037185F
MNINKRRRVQTRRCEKLEDLQGNSKKATFLDQGYQRYVLDMLPPEVLETILRLLPFHDVATSVRLVSRHCSTVAATVLNSAFLAFGTRLDNLINRSDKVLKDAKTNAALLVRSKALNALAVIKAQYKMLRAVTWRYTHPPTNQQKFPRLCFYAGRLLDDLNELLGTIANLSIANSSLMDSITCFVIVCKRFMNFFEKVSERRLNRSALISGCKIVDVLDCLVEGRQVLFFKVTPKVGVTRRTVSMKLRYVIKHAWFTCLEISKNSMDNSWRDEQRFMYLRLRRLVGSVNEHLFENLYYEHELLLQVPLPLRLRPPPASTYSGYGEYGGQFFYYGNMNKYAYESKFVHTLNSMNYTLESRQEVRRPPSFDLVIEVELKCTPELAPLAVRKFMKPDEFETYETKTCRHQQLFLKMNVTCPASMANRLPGNFVWELHSPRRTRKHS